jgi:glycosyltransferase involved in cell wall biosynthesis
MLDGRPRMSRTPVLHPTAPSPESQAGTGQDAAITVILPVKHYVPRFLKAAVQSILDQTSGDWRLVLVADVSVAAELESFLQDELSDARCQLVSVGTPNLAATINAGMRQASTGFVTLLLGDDAFETNAIEVLRRAIRAHPDVDFFHTSRRIIDGEGRSISSVHPSRARFEWKDFLDGSPVKHLLCWRRELALAIGGVDERLSTSGPDDYDFPWSMFEHGARFRALPECLYIYRNHCDGFRNTTHHPRTVRLLGVRKILRKHGVGFWRSWRMVHEKRQRGLAGQSIYSSRLARWFYRLVGYDASRSWRQSTYR